MSVEGQDERAWKVSGRRGEGWKVDQGPEILSVEEGINLVARYEELARAALASRPVSSEESTDAA